MDLQASRNVDLAEIPLEQIERLPLQRVKVAPNHLECKPVVDREVEAGQSFVVFGGGSVCG